MTMFLRSLLLFPGLLACPLHAEPGKDGFLPLPGELTALDSQAGREVMAGSQSAPFWRLAQFFSIQQHLTTCGVASCTMVLNALPIGRPRSATHGEFGLYTAENFFTPEVSGIVTREQVQASGMSLAQLAKVLGTFPVKVAVIPANAVALADFRAELQRCTVDGKRLMLVNYLRKSLGQSSGGHISPVGAYSAEKDRVLVMDVSTYKYPWVWVETEHLFQAMGGNDKEKVSRGFVTISPRAEP